MKITINSHNLAGFLIILIMTVLIIGCSSNSNSSPTNLNSENKVLVKNEELERNRQLWLNSKISNYNFVISKMDMGTWGWIPSLIKVRANQVVSKTPVEKLRPMTRIDGYNDFETVEKIFNQIQEASNKRYRVDVKYNKDFGYPEKIIIDDHKTLTDSLVSFEITKFEVVKDN